MTKLSEIWKEITAYLNDGISIIPVRDKDQQLQDGTTLPRKSPYSKWKKHQTEIITEGELFHLMERYDTTAIAMIGGKVSGNLEMIDIDVKNWPGIDAMLFSDIQNLYPKLFDKLRIHKTPSGGFHIPYRIKDHEPDGNLKLCYREGAKEAAIETRGEGGFCVTSPSLNYTIHKQNKIPVITWEERCSIIALCQSYNQRIKTVALTTTNKGHNDYYSENPFEHFNNSAEGSLVLTNNGWSVLKESSKFIWFTRPDKNNGISASYNREKRVFYIFTSSTAFEPSKGYTPSTALSMLQFNSDKKATFAHLVSSGYGKIKPEVEKRKAEKLARQGINPPANFSTQAIELHSAISAKLISEHPFGTFWVINPETNKYEISREALTNVAKELGFRLYRADLVQLNGQIFYTKSEREFQDILKEYIHEEDADEYELIANSYESFMQRNGKYTISRLPILDDNLIVKDSNKICYKFFNNCIVVITAKGIAYAEYHELENKYIPSSKIQLRDYNFFEGGLYLDYLQKATNWTEQSTHIKKCIGYLSHEYKDETTGYIIVLTEQCPDPQEGGGSGKNLFCNLLSNTTTYHSKNGGQIKFDEKFFQSWNGQRIMGISDVPDNFNFAFLKEPSTGTFILKKLFKDEVEIPVEDGPKFIVQTNFSYEITDGGLKRRIIHIEFTDFFTKCGGVDVHYGKHFTKDWTNEDWYGFDTLIIESVQLYLSAGRKLTNTELTKTGWEKQFIYTFGRTTTDMIYEFSEGWFELKTVEISAINQQIQNYYIENNIAKSYQPSKVKINKAIEYYCRHLNIPCNLRAFTKELGVTKKVAIFY